MNIEKVEFSIIGILMLNLYGSSFFIISGLCDKRVSRCVDAPMDYLPSGTGSYKEFRYYLLISPFMIYAFTAPSPRKKINFSDTNVLFSELFAHRNLKLVEVMP